jgi:polyhydroxyalkanoate synthase
LNSKPEQDPDRWLAAAASQPGSWWTHWGDWLAAFGGREVPARSHLGRARYREIEPAPGRYVKEKCG